MAEYRSVQCKFWKDSQVMDNFTPEDKLFWIYLLTNEYTTMIGVYKLIKKIVAFEIGYSVETIDNLIKRFENFHKLIKYDDRTKEIAVLNWGKYNLRKGGRPIICCIESEIKKIENINLVKLVAYNSKEHISKDILEVLLKYNIDINMEIDMYMEMKMYMKHVGVIVDEHVDEHVNDDKKEALEINKLMKWITEKAKDIPGVQNLSPGRVESIVNCYKQYGIKKIEMVIEKAGKSDWLKNKKHLYNIDWIFDIENFVKVLEERYIGDLNAEDGEKPEKIKGLYVHKEGAKDAFD